MSFGAPSTLGKFSPNYFAYYNGNSATGTFSLRVVNATYTFYDPYIFKYVVRDSTGNITSSNYYLNFAVYIYGEARGTGSKMYYGSYGPRVTVNGVDLRTRGRGSEYVADTYANEAARYQANLGPTLGSTNITGYIQFQSVNGNDLQSAQEISFNPDITIIPTQIDDTSDVVFVGDSSVSSSGSGSKGSNVSAIVCLPDDKKITGKVIHIKSTHASKRVIICSVDGTYIENNTTNVSFEFSSGYSYPDPTNNNISGSGANSIVMPNGYAGLSIVYDGSKWRVLSYYNGTFNSNIYWAAKVTTSSMITKAVTVVNLTPLDVASDNIKYLNLPDPAGPFQELIIIASGGNVDLTPLGIPYEALRLGLCRGSYDLEANNNDTLVLTPSARDRNACIRLLSNGSKWYILSLFDGSSFTTLTDSSSISPTTQMASSEGTISMSDDAVVSVPEASAVLPSAVLYNIKAYYDTKTSLELTTKGVTGTAYFCSLMLTGIAGSLSTTRSYTTYIKSPAGYVPAATLLGFIDSSGAKRYFIVSFFQGF